MRVYYVSSGIEACYNLRCLLPLTANGWDGDRTSLTGPQKGSNIQQQAVMQADVVVFHRPEGEKKLQLARLLKSLGKKIVYDNDDTYKNPEHSKLTEYMAEKQPNKMEDIETFIKEADLVTCTTEYLKDEYLKLNDNVVVLPNCVDPFYFDDPLKNESDKIRIGIVGSVGTTGDLEVLKPIIDHYEHDERVQLVAMVLPDPEGNPTVQEIYKNEYAYWNSKNVEMHYFVDADKYYDAINELRLDMVVIPRADNEVNKAKSNIKFLEFAMLGVPCICQEFMTDDSPYQSVPDCRYLLLADTTDEWIEQIEKLINDKDYRVALGKEAKKYVSFIYDINNVSHMWEDAYTSIL
jgi:glycosyltransferase involved in cell wall biosynthesis